MTEQRGDWTYSAQKYRDDLAYELRNEPDKQLRRFLLDLEHPALRYKLAKAEKRALLQGADLSSEPLRYQARWVGEKVSSRSDFPISNESRLQTLFPLIKDKTGGIFGVGSDQVFDIFTNTGATSACLFDIATPNTLQMRALLEVGLYHRKVFGKSPQPSEFFNYFKDDNLDQLRRVLLINFSAVQLNHLWLLMKGFRQSVFSPQIAYSAFMCQRAQLKNNSGETYAWYSTPEKLDKVLTAYEEGKIFIINGNLADEKIMERVKSTARHKQIKFDVLYLSNVEESLGRILLPHHPSRDLIRAWKNLRGLPVSAAAVILRTTNVYSRKLNKEPNSIAPSGWGTRVWHYNVETWQHRLSHYTKNYKYDSFGWADMAEQLTSDPDSFVSYLS